MLVNQWLFYIHQIITLKEQISTQYIEYTMNQSSCGSESYTGRNIYLMIFENDWKWNMKFLKFTVWVIPLYL